MHQGHDICRQPKPNDKKLYIKLYTIEGEKQTVIITHLIFTSKSCILIIQESEKYDKSGL